MSSAYTSEVHDGKATFRSFVWKCASAYFSEGLFPRDDDRVVWERKVVHDCEAELDRLSKMSNDEVEKEFEREVFRRRQQNENATKDSAEVLARYRAMLQEVTRWESSPLHADLKTFMTSQLEESIRFDCEPFHISIPTHAGDWQKERIEWTTVSLSNARKDLDQKIRRSQNQKTWLEALEPSVGPRP